MTEGDGGQDGTGGVGTRRRQPLWAFLALAGAVLLAGWLVPGVRFADARDTMMVLGVLALAGGIWRRRPGARVGWWLAVAGAGLVVLTSLLVNSPTVGLALPGDWSQTLLGTGGLLVFAAGFAIIGRWRGRADAADTLDATMIALAAFLVLYVLVIHPALSRDQAPITARISVPLATLVLLTMAVRAMLAIGIPSVAFGLLLLAAAALIATVVSLLVPTWTSGWRESALSTEPLWVCYGVLLGAAGLHPSLGRPRPPPRRYPYTMSRRRTALFIVLAVVTPMAWAFEIARAAAAGDDPTGFMVPVGAAGALLLLLVTRLTLTGRLAERRADQLSRRSGDLAEAIREQQELHRQVHYQATHDSLTGLPNRAALLERMEWALTRPAGPGRHSLMLIDLDNFKDINSRHGHPAGDEVLAVTARRLLEVTPPGGTLARISGDQFATLLEDTSADRATSYAERIRQALQQPYQINGHELVLSGSVGLATTVPETPPAPAEALRDADLALHVAKAEGKDRVVSFRPELRRTESSYRRLSIGLRRALDNDELAVDYQPVVELGTGRVVAVEALLRWHPRGEQPVPPAEFIPVAEETGMIKQIGVWTLRRACRDVQRWYALRGIAVAVNVSARQLDTPEFATTVEAAMREMGLPGEALIIEITESSLVATSTVSRAMDQLERLRRNHVRVAIDDFGTGYSSLAYLARLPVDVVKIDKSFVHNPKPAATGQPWEFARTIVQMVESLGLESIAEGVETTEQAEALQRLRCRYAQGYLFASPQPWAVVDRLITESGTLAPGQSGDRRASS